MNIFLILKNIVWMFLVNLNEIATNFANFDREMEILMADDQKRKYNETSVSYLCSKNLQKAYKSFKK